MDRTHTVATFGEMEHRVEAIFHIHDLAFAVMEAASKNVEWHILGFLCTKGYYKHTFFVVFEKVLFLREKPFLCDLHAPDDKSPVSGL